MADNLKEDASETSPYVEFLKGERTHEELLLARIRDRGRMAVSLGVLLIIAISGFVYQLRLPKQVPYINNVDSHGQVVSRLLLRPEEVPANDPNKQAATRTFLKYWIDGARIRSIDREATGKGLTTALRISKGPALTKLRMETNADEIFKLLEKERVEVLMPKDPIQLPGTNTWIAEWDEIIRGSNNQVLRRQECSGSFTFAQQDDWVNGYNAYGLGIIDWSIQPCRK